MNPESLRTSDVPQAHLPLGKTETSGSTGVPVEVQTTAITRQMWNALTVREHLWQRRDVGKRLGAIRYMKEPLRDPKGGKTASWGPPIAYLYKTGPGGFIHVGHSIDLIADWLPRFNPHYLLTYPSIVAALLEQPDYAKPPALEEICLFSEPVPRELKKALREKWGVRMSEIYSANETGYIAFRCTEFGNLHVQSENVLVEILNDDNTPCAVGESGRVVEAARKALGHPFRIEIEPVECIERGPSGKFEEFLSLLPAGTRL